MFFLFDLLFPLHLLFQHVFYLEDLPAFLKQKDENIERYLDDKDNESKIAKYENYARVRILHGETQEYYVPKDFR